MKKKILLIVAIMAMLVCVFALSASAAEFDKTEKVTVTLTNGTQECALYDADGDELVWYTLDGGATLNSVKAKDLVYSSETDLRTISLADGTALQKDNETSTNLIVVANLRGRTFTNLVHNGYKSTFDQSKVIQYVYLPSTVTSIACNQFQNCTNLKVLDFPSDAKFSFNDSNFAPGCTSLLEINLTGLTGVTGSAHFSKCTSLNKIIGLENSTTTRIGKQMFQFTAITEVKLSNTVTTLGEGAFNSCKQLKVAYLGASLNTFEINSGFKASDAFNSTAIEFLYMPSTVTAVAGYTFSNANSLRVIFFTGTKEQAVAMYNASNMTNNNPFKALGASESQFISYEAYNELPAGDTGKYIVYGYNVCDAFYKGIHELDPEKSNACAGVCANCGKQSLAANPVHDYVTTIVYENYLANGTKTQTCQNEGCEHKATPVVTYVAPIISSFNGYSTKIEGEGLTFGYTIDYEALEEYVKVSGKSVELGFVVAAKSLLGENAPLNENGEAASEKVIKATVVTWTTDDKANANVAKYTGADFKITGSWTAESMGAEIYMAGYIIDATGYAYLNANGSSNTADYTTYNTVLNSENKPSVPEVV